MQFNRLSDNDISLIDNKLVGYDFGFTNDVAELHIYDTTNKLLLSNQKYTSYKPNPDYGLNDKYIQSIEIYPEEDLKNHGFEIGSYKLIYNFFRNISNKEFFLKSISSDRTEIIVTSNSLQNDEIETIFNKLKSNFEDYNFIKNYLINFDKNDIYLITNIALDKNSDVYNILLKLYTPLTSNITVKLLSTFCEEIIQTNEVDVTLVAKEILPTIPSLKSANFDLELDSKSSFSTDYLDTNTLSTNIEVDSSIQALLKNTALKLNINYENFSEFSHYGSVEQRILNFVYKVKQIELYTSQKNSNLSNVTILNDKITKIVTGFDDYEYFLYTSFSTKSYPKNIDGSLKSSTSNDVITWLGDSSKDMGNSGILGDAKYYDTFNKDSLINNIPNYLIVDERNKPFTIFCNMVGQHFDSIWVASNKFTNLYESNNNLGKGISPEVVENVLKSFGVKLYNSMSNVDVTNLASKSYNKEIYKRIYHNLPFLKKYKGTRNGLIQLINIFGVPDTLFRIYEYGSVRNDVNLKEHVDNVFNYCVTSNRSGSIQVPYKDVNNDFVPQSTLFRIKLNSKRTPTTTTTGDFDNRDYNSSDFYTTQTVNDYSENILKIKLSGSDYLTVVAETYNSDKSLVYLKKSTGEISAKIPVELYKNNWSTFLLQRIYDSNLLKTTYTLTVGQIVNNKICKKTVSLNISSELTTIHSPSMTMTIGTSLDFCLQKLIMFDEILLQSVFDSHILNVNSIQGNEINTFVNKIICYIPFGSDLKTYNHNIVQTLTSKIYFNDFYKTVSLLTFENKNNYVTNYDKIYYNSSNTLSTKRLTNKISIPTKKYYGNVLSTFKQIEQKSDDYVDYKFLDVVFSPTFEQDDDIINTIGYFNLDDYIGNPSEYGEAQYNDLKSLRQIYLTKLISKYNVKDYINIVNYIDNSLFKMIKDFVPISNNTSSGILIRQNILNRNKIKGVSTIFEQFFIDDISFKQVNLEAISQNLNNDFDINLRTDFDERNKNKFLRTLNKIQKEEFRTSMYNQNINFFNNSFQRYATFDKKNKYQGVQVKSSKLNGYSIGDISLGKSSNVTSYVDKIGLFTNISTNDIFDKKCNVQLKYLVDKNGGLTDLNKLNRNVTDIQGLFGKDDSSIISLFDNIKYSNQKSLDGNKKIFSSGFSYSPVLYFSDKDKYFKFDTTNDTTSTYFRYFENNSRDITNIKNVYDIFDTKDVDIQNNFTVGNYDNKVFSTYEISESGQYEFNVDALLRINSTNDALSFKYNLTSYRNYISSDTIIDSISYIHHPTEPQYDNDGNVIKFDEIKPVYKPLEVPILGQDSMTYFNNYWSNEKNSYNVSGIFIPFDPNRTWKLLESGITKSNEKYRIYVSDDVEQYKTGYIYEIYDANGNLEKLQDIYYDLYEETISLTLPVKELNFSFTLFDKIVNINNLFIEQKGRGVILKDISSISNGVNNSYNKGEKILFVLEQVYINDVTPNTIILENSSSVYAIKNNFNLKLGANESLINSLTPKNISISNKLNDYIGNGIFNMSGSTLYSKYGEINDIFDIKNGDILYIKDSKTLTNYFIEISDIKSVGKNIVLSFLNDIPTYVMKENISECIFISKSLDETNVIINFNKKMGETSYGFIIPSNINPSFMNNIDKITKEVKLKLLNDYSLNKNSV